MNKIKVIDLLNMISKGEEVPKKIKYNNETFTIREEKDDYANQNYWFTDRFSLLDLNEEIEIIEEEPRYIEVCGSLFTKSEYDKLAEIKEDKKIEHIEDYVDFVNLKDDEKFDYLYEMESRIIDYINKKESE